jgi:two-component system chemotaxis response regulator CheB
MTAPPIRILVVDDSQTVRAVLRRMLTVDGDVTVDGEAADGLEAVELAARLDPDVVVMDLDLPGLDGLAASRLILEHRSTPILVVTSARGAQARVAEAFQATAHRIVGVFCKPEVPDEWHRLGHDLLETIRGLSRRPFRPETEGTEVRAPRSTIQVIAVGASTGGPAALRDLLTSFRAPPRASLVVVQHIAPGFETGLAEWLTRESGLDVAVANDDEELRPGRVRIAPSGAHLAVEHLRHIRLDRAARPLRGHRPSATVLFDSLAEEGEAAAVAAILLTGMGDDGVEGMLRLRSRGALTVAQSRASCAVFGMPKAALESGAAEFELSPVAIARLLEGRGQEGDGR